MILDFLEQDIYYFYFYDTVDIIQLNQGGETMSPSVSKIPSSVH